VQVYDSPSLNDIAAYARRELDSLWDEYKRLHQPHRYKVDLSDGLYALKSELLARYGSG
jgi:nicotinate phosphoribosyltransferase